MTPPDAATLWAEFPMLARAYGDFQDFEENLRASHSCSMSHAVKALVQRLATARLEFAHAQERMAIATRPLSANDRPASMSARRGNRLILWLYGPTWFSGEPLLAALAANEDAAGILLRVDSSGGGLGAGIDLANALRNHRARKLAVIDRSCWSAAVLPTLACDRVYMRSNATMLIHRCSRWATGNADAFAEALRACRQDDDLVARAIVGSRKRIRPPNGFAALQGSEYFMSADEALRWGFVDRVLADLLPVTVSAEQPSTGLDEAIPPAA